MFNLDYCRRGHYFPNSADSIEMEGGSSSGNSSNASPSGSPLARFGEALWNAISWVLEEFEPWLKWMIFDAVMAVVVKAVASRWKALSPYLEAVGWL